MPLGRLLIVDDDSALRGMLSSLFEERGLVSEEAGSGTEALEKLGQADYDVVLSDIKMPGMSGIDLVAEVRKLRPETPVVLMTAFGSIASAVGAMRAGALDYITKPFEPEVVSLTIERALERRSLEQENRRLRRAVDQTSALGDLIGASPAMREIFALIGKIAHNSSNVLITGESGTGKEVVARTIHFYGARAEKPFLPINCTAIPEGLLESELFGHVRGAFTGAYTSKKGLFEQAGGGTLFLDEIGDLGGSLQAKLLRVLQDREIRPVGGNQTFPIDARVIAATNKDLEVEMKEGRFREDLFYRLNVIPIHIPPLRERPEDIPVLARGFLERHAAGRHPYLSQAVLDHLMTLPWKGNARELENALERALALEGPDEISVESMPNPPADAGNEADPGRLLCSAHARQLSLQELEELYMDQVLERTGGNKVKAARILGIDRKTLYRRAERRILREKSSTSCRPIPTSPTT